MGRQRRLKQQKRKNERAEVEAESGIFLTIEFMFNEEFMLNEDMNPDRPEDFTDAVLRRLMPVLPSFSALIPLIEYDDPSTVKKYGVKADPKTLEILRYAAKEKKVVVVAKIYWGDPREKLCDAVGKIPLHCLVVGNRGLGKIKRAILGSVSNYVVNNATCPVTVVKTPEPEN